MFARRDALAILAAAACGSRGPARAATLSDWAEQVRIAKMFEEGRIPAKSFRNWTTKMAPNLLEGDVVLADLRLGGKSPGRGELIVSWNRKGDVSFDRVIGLPGERFAMRGGIVVLNGAAVAQTPAGTIDYASFGRTESRNVFGEQLPGARPYKIARMQTGGGYLDDIPELVIPEGRLYLLGDNRDNSVDSRSDGPTALDKVIGRVVYRLRPNPDWLVPRDSVPGLPRE